MTESTEKRFRTLTAKEIAEIVRAMREAHEWKQITLAEVAHVTERTIQRVEGAEENVGPASLKKIAIALSLPEEHFIQAHEFMSVEDMEKAVEEARRNLTTIDLIKTATGEILMQVLQGCDAYHFDLSRALPNAKDACAVLFDYARDLGDLWSDISFTEKRQYEEEMTTMIGDIETAGCVVSAGIRTGTYKYAGADKPFSMKIGYIVVTDKQYPPKVVLVPRNIQFS